MQKKLQDLDPLDVRIKREIQIEDVTQVIDLSSKQETRDHEEGGVLCLYFGFFCKLRETKVFSCCDGKRKERRGKKNKRDMRKIWRWFGRESLRQVSNTSLDVASLMKVKSS